MITPLLAVLVKPGVDTKAVCIVVVENSVSVDVVVRYPCKVVACMVVVGRVCIYIRGVYTAPTTQFKTMNSIIESRCARYIVMEEVLCSS